LWLFFELNDAIYAPLISNQLTKRKFSDSETAFLISPIKKVGVLKLQDELIKLKKKSKFLDKQTVQRLLKEYSWMSCFDVNDSP